MGVARVGQPREGPLRSSEGETDEEDESFRGNMVEVEDEYQRVKGRRKGERT